MKNNFPRLDGYEQEDVDEHLLAEIFPWGCRQLLQPCDFSDGYEVREFQSLCQENIYRAIKYGVWSLPEKEYVHNYSAFQQLKKSGKKLKIYWAFLLIKDKRKYLYGIAEVLDYHAEETFRFWQDSEGKSLVMNGVFQLAFIAVGKIEVQERVTKLLLPNLYRELRKSELPISEFRNSDKQEDQLRDNSVLPLEGKELEKFSLRLTKHLETYPNYRPKPAKR